MRYVRQHTAALHCPADCGKKSNGCVASCGLLQSMCNSLIHVSQHAAALQALEEADFWKQLSVRS
jgi:hypothetical protein